MISNDLYIRVNAADPTQTTAVRRSFEQELARRFAAFKAKVRARITAPPSELAVNAYAFPSSPSKVSEFLTWLERAADAEILEIRRGTPMSSSNPAWSNIYLRSAYQKGMASATRNLTGQGATVSPQYLQAAFLRPIHADRAGLIYTRAFAELKNVTTNMATAMSRVLAQGIVEGESARAVAKKLFETVDGLGYKRSRVIARTEIIRAHAEGSLNTYQEAGVEGVNVQAEFATAEDNKVCPKCEKLQGKVMTIPEARGLLPVHPNCRCAWLPVVKSPKGVVLN